MLIETTVVGSYPQPRWLIHRDRLGSPLILAHDYKHDVSVAPTLGNGSVMAVPRSRSARACR